MSGRNKQDNYTEQSGRKSNKNQLITTSFLGHSRYYIYFYSLVQWQAWLRNTRPDPPTQIEIQRDEARKQLTITRAKALDQAWQDRKAELALEQAEDRKFILGVAAASRTGGAGGEAQQDSPLTSLPDAEESEKSAARKQIEEREAARKCKHRIIFVRSGFCFVVNGRAWP